MVDEAGITEKVNSKKDNIMFSAVATSYIQIKINSTGFDYFH